MRRFFSALECWLVRVTSIVAFIFLTGQQKQPLSREVAITLSAGQTTFVSGELIFLEDTVHNKSGNTLRIPEPSQHYSLRVQVQDAQGHFVRCGPVVTRIVGSTPIISLLPNEKQIGVISLLDCVNTGNRTPPTSNLLPGEYKVWVEFNDVKSNVVKLRIVEPLPQDRVVQQQLQDLRKGRVTPRNKIMALEKLLQSNTQDIYLRNIYEWLLGLYWMHPSLIEPRRLTRMCLEYFDKSPDFPGLYVPLYYYRSGLERGLNISRDSSPTTEQKRVIEKKLQELKAKYPTKRIARFVGKEIEKAKAEWFTRKK